MSLYRSAVTLVPLFALTSIFALSASADHDDSVSILDALNAATVVEHGGPVINVPGGGPVHGGGNPGHGGGGVINVPGGGPVHGGGGYGGGYNGGYNGGWHPAPRPSHPWYGHGDGYPWAHWDHPVIIRPIYGWNWSDISVVTCTSENSYGERFSVSEDSYSGWGYSDRMDQIEDASLDYCVNETGDYGCRLVGCNVGY